MLRKSFFVAAMIVSGMTAPVWGATNPGYEGQPGNQSSNQGNPGSNGQTGNTGSSQSGPTGYEGQPGNQSH